MLYYFLVKPGNCFDIFERDSTSGIFTIYPFDGSDEDFLTIEVFCDMETFGGGWTVSIDYDLKGNVPSLINASRTVVYSITSLVEKKINLTIT